MGITIKPVQGSLLTNQDDSWKVSGLRAGLAHFVPGLPGKTIQAALSIPLPYKRFGKDQWDFEGPPIMGPLTQTIPIPLPEESLKVWEWYGKLTIRGSHDFLVPGITLDVMTETNGKLIIQHGSMGLVYLYIPTFSLIFMAWMSLSRSTYCMIIISTFGFISSHV